MGGVDGAERRTGWVLEFRKRMAEGVAVVEADVDSDVIFPQNGFAERSQHLVERRPMQPFGIDDDAVKIKNYRVDHLGTLTINRRFIKLWRMGADCE